MKLIDVKKSAGILASKNEYEVRVFFPLVTSELEHFCLEKGSHII